MISLHLLLVLFLNNIITEMSQDIDEIAELSSNLQNSHCEFTQVSITHRYLLPVFVEKLQKNNLGSRRRHDCQEMC